MNPRVPAAILLTVVVLTAMAVAGCGGDDDGTTPTGITVDPSDTADDSSYAFTPTITITEQGFVPLQATAVFGQTLVFVNETDRAQTITFINGSPHIGGSATVGPIAPGASASVPEPLDSAISLLYESTGLPGQQGRLQVDPGVDEL